MNDWVTALAPAEMAINNAVTDGTGFSPVHITYGMLLTMTVNGDVRTRVIKAE